MGGIAGFILGGKNNHSQNTQKRLNTASVPYREVPMKCKTCGHWKNRDRNGGREPPLDYMWCIHPAHVRRTNPEDACGDWEPVGRTSC